MTSNNEHQSEIWNSQVRGAFWLFGITVGAFLTYTTRYYLNGDGINYIEMGEALRNGLWSGLVNLTESPGYAVLLGLGQTVLSTDRSNELVLLKIVNFVSFVAAMAACDVFMNCIKKQWSESWPDDEKLLPFYLVSGLCYSMFLFAALNWVRPRLVAPEMIVFALVLATICIILKIRENPSGYQYFAVLGLFSGISFLFKSFFFPFSAVFFVIAGLLTNSLKKAIPRVALSMAVMLAVCAPLMISLSASLGRFSYGEVGRFNYTILIAGEGELEHPPEVLNPDPEVLFYGKNQFVDCTRPAGWDLAYWKLGLKPVFNFVTQLEIFLKLTLAVILDSPFLFLFAGLWIIAHWRLGTLRVGKLFPPSPFFILMAVASAGVGVYCLIHIEMRYLASFLFLGFAALAISPTYDPNISGVKRRIVIPSIILSLFILGLVANTVVDQTLRGLSSSGGKPSFKDTYYEMVAIKNWLRENNISSRSRTAIIGLPLSYWARLAEVKIVAEIFDQERFLACGPQKRAKAAESFKSAGVKAVIAQGRDYDGLVAEGWQKVPGTRDFYILLTSDRKSASES